MKPSRDKNTGQFVQSTELRAQEGEDYRAVIAFYEDDGRITHRAVKGFKGKTMEESLEMAKKWIAKNLNPKLNCSWDICDDIGIELEGS